MAERPEIVAGLKTAIERGYSLEFAKQSFINAGYPRQDVEDSARYLTSGITSYRPPSQPVLPTVQQPVQQSKPPQYQQPTQQQQPRSAQISQQAQVNQPLAILPVIQQPRLIQPNYSDSRYLETKKSKKSIAVIIILSIILLLLVAGLLITLFKKEWILDLLSSLGLT